MNQYIGFNGCSYGFFFSIPSNFLPSQFVSLHILFSAFLQVIFSLFSPSILGLLRFNFLSSLPVRYYLIFAHAQTILNDSLSSFPQCLQLLYLFFYLRFKYYSLRYAHSSIEAFTFLLISSFYYDPF